MVNLGLEKKTKTGWLGGGLAGWSNSADRNRDLDRSTVNMTKRQTARLLLKQHRVQRQSSGDWRSERSRYTVYWWADDGRLSSTAEAEQVWIIAEGRPDWADRVQGKRDRKADRSPQRKTAQKHSLNKTDRQTWLSLWLAPCRLYQVEFECFLGVLRYLYLVPLRFWVVSLCMYCSMRVCNRLKLGVFFIGRWYLLCLSPPFPLFSINPLLPSFYFSLPPFVSPWLSCHNSNSRFLPLLRHFFFLRALASSLLMM